MAGVKGILQVDGYAGYRELAKKGAIGLACCWSHVRRRLYDRSIQGWHTSYLGRDAARSPLSSRQSSKALRSTQHSASLPSRTRQIAMPLKEMGRRSFSKPKMPAFSPRVTQRDTTRLFAFANLDYLVAEFNLRHCREVIQDSAPLDVHYLALLGPDVIPALDDVIATRGFSDKSWIAVRAALDHARRENEADWRSWTFRAWRLSQQLGADFPS